PSTGPLCRLCSGGMENGSAWRQTLSPKACKEAAMSHCEEWDLVVLGSGRARSFASSLASQGKRSAVIERRYVTGSFPSIAWLPSQNLIHGPKVANYFRRGAEFGIVAGDWKVEMPAVRERKQKMIDGMVALNYDACPGYQSGRPRRPAARKNPLTSTRRHSSPVRRNRYNRVDI